ncbi:MAG TPA: VOC family protein [Ramlibacter sp.]|nr:VOC family protein [Ramlibacter sp.]
MHDAELRGEVRIATVRADDWPEMVRYYRDSLGLKQKFADEASQYAMFEGGPIQVAVEGPAKPAFVRGARAGATLLNFQVADLSATLQALTDHGARVLTKVCHGPGYDFVAVGDPEGNEHIIYQRVPVAR